MSDTIEIGLHTFRSKTLQENSKEKCVKAFTSIPSNIVSNAWDIANVKTKVKTKAKTKRKKRSSSK